MAQTLNQLSNPWGASAPDGSGIDAQRSDLFTLDFSLPLSAIRSILIRATNNGSKLAGSLLGSLPDQLRLPFFANSVEFPEARTSASVVKRHEIPLTWPGMDDAPGQINITFTVESPTAIVDARSKVLAFLRAWRAVVRAGRPGQQQGELSLDLLTASRDGTRLIPDYRHNFSIYLWRGRIPASNEAPFDNFTAANSGVELAQEWTIVRGWLCGMQATQLRHAASGILEVRASFQAEAVVEGLGGSVSFGAIRAV